MYDAWGRPSLTTDSNYRVRGRSYDAAGRLTQISYGGDPNYTYQSYGYTPGYAKPTSVMNELGYVTEWTLDIYERVVGETGNGGRVYGYNVAGDLLTMTDYLNNQTSWGYDIYGRQTSKRDANNTEILRWSYDANGRVTNRWTVGKGDTRYSYDALGKVTNVVYASSPGVAFAYDSANRLTNMLDGIGGSRYTYDVSGALASEDGPWVNGAAI